MNIIKTVKIDAIEIAILNSEDICTSDVQTALDFMMSVNFEFFFVKSDIFNQSPYELFVIFGDNGGLLP